MSRVTILLNGGPKHGQEINVRIIDPIVEEITVPYKVNETQMMGFAKYAKSIRRNIGKFAATQIIYDYVSPDIP